ncbi:MAG: tetratricopeptide repeat protein [Candidatus Nitrospinota bacterium M3_3B_026]
MAHDLSGIKILVVDNPAEARNTREALRDAGFGVVSEMTDGLQVLTGIKKDPPELMLVSYTLPRYSGSQVFSSLKKDRELARIKFVMIVPKLSRREMEQMKEMGVKNWLSRPFGPDELRDMIFGLYGMETDTLKALAAETAVKAGKLFDKGDFEGALKLFREAADEFTDPGLVFMQGRCYMELEMHDQAIAAFQNTKQIDSRHPEVDKWLGVALQRKKDYLASVRVLERAAKRKNADAETNVELGKSYLGADMVEAADGAFDKATRMEPGNVENRTQIGNAYLDKGLYQKAEGAFGAALDISPDKIPLYNRMAIALRKQGKHGEAINIYIKALNVDKNDEGLYYNLARALYESGQKDKAIKALDRALALDPGFSEAKALRREYAGGEHPS